jgi:class 3 adenylate cyclase
MARRLLHFAVGADLRDLLPAVQAPTLVIHRRDDAVIPIEHGRDLAAAIAGARIVELKGQDNSMIGGDTEAVLDEIEEVKTLGDGFLAIFDGPARAIRCAQAIERDLQRIGIVVRAGVHIGEVQREAGDVRGLAVHIAARIGALSNPGEVLVSSTVRELVVGSGLRFEERGSHSLNGVPGTWRLLRLIA